MHKIIFILFLFTQVVSAQEVIDKIVAVVDNEIILQSEVEFQVNLTAAKSNLDPKRPRITIQNYKWNGRRKVTLRSSRIRLNNRLGRSG